MIEGSWKLVEDRVSGVRRLYDLAADPNEQRALPSTNPRLEQELEAAAARLAAQRLEGAPDPVEPSRQERALLRALGYIAE